MKTEVRRKVAQARAAIEDTTDCTSVPVILTAMQQRICNLLGEATIISLPPGDPNAEITLPVTMSSVTTVTLTESCHPKLKGKQCFNTLLNLFKTQFLIFVGLQTASASCEETKSLDAETTYHTLEEGGMVEYCTTTEATPTVVTAMESHPVKMLAAVSSTQPPSQAKPQELKSRIALNSARLLQEQWVTNVHVRQIAQHLKGQNQLLQMIRRSQEAQAYAQERQAYAQERQAYAQEAEAYAQEAEAYAQEAEAYAQERQAYAQERQAYAQERQAYAQEAGLCPGEAGLCPGEAGLPRRQA
ncbi:nuclear apoptosis-inducing factor 1-like [Oncorhynchus keta]|uniref:nuclear apoptosis-inducing factor 1-like n=1 Tax=Oncorhynchus keta TaxID=8018 RepID=UPI002279F5B3|nr:nuclear apoptosis-inducing factor 1-like [Oncorhynchus keta]